MAKSELQEDTTDEEASKALHDLSWIDLTEPDQKHNCVAMLNERLAPIWKEEQGVCVCVLLLQDLLQSCSRGGGGEWRTCAMRDDEPRPVWMSLPITH